MKYDCDVVQDLLPLYQDKICSSTSKRIVEQHISECAVCKKIAGQMGDNAVEERLIEEKNNVIQKHQKMVERKTTAIGITTGGILSVPTIVCLICNIAIGHAVDWFFIVLAAMLLAASFLVVPFIAETEKVMWVIVSAVFSLVLLLLACCIYTRGDWFFVASSGSVFGISLVFAPFVIPNFCGIGKLKKHKAALTVLWDTVWLYLLLAACGIYIQGGILYWKMAISFSAYMVLLVWIFVIVICYGKGNRWIKAGILTAVTGIWFGLFNDIMNFFLEPVGAADGFGLGSLDLSKGFPINDYAVFNANCLFVIIAASVCVGGLLIFWGIKKEKREHELEK